MQKWLHPEDFLPVVDIQALLAGFDGANFSTLKLVERVAAMRETPIALLSCPIPVDTCHGWWLSSPICEFIVYESRTLGFHQDHNICHELAHILLGHKTSTLDEKQARHILESSQPLTLASSGEGRVLMGTLTGLQAIVRTHGDVLMREIAAEHHALREREAEALANVLQGELIRRIGLNALTRPSRSLEMRQIVQSLGFDR